MKNSESRVEILTWGMCQEPRESKLGVVGKLRIGTREQRSFGD